MRNRQLVLVDCRLRRGAFSGERVILLTMLEHPGDYVGIAPLGHCLGEDRRPLGADSPPADTEIRGFVEAFLIANGSDEARVELPDGEAIRVPASNVAYQSMPGGGVVYVPVGS